MITGAIAITVFWPHAVGSSIILSIDDTFKLHVVGGWLQVRSWLHAFIKDIELSGHFLLLPFEKVLYVHMGSLEDQQLTPAPDVRRVLPKHRQVIPLIPWQVPDHGDGDVALLLCLLLCIPCLQKCMCRPVADLPACQSGMTLPDAKCRRIVRSQPRVVTAE